MQRVEPSSGIGLGRPVKACDHLCRCLRLSVLFPADWRRMWEGRKVAVPSALGWDRVDPNVECGKRTVLRAGLLERRAEFGRGTVEPVEPATASTATWRSAPDPTQC
jgi:hypothetical protein